MACCLPTTSCSAASKTVHAVIIDCGSKNEYVLGKFLGKALKQMQRNREKLTEAEARYFIRQLLLSCQYLAEQRIIRRDLKFGNLLLDDEMELKVADLGLAARIGLKGERKKTLCGTASYIAREISSKMWHSFEEDIWSIGSILYAILVGRPSNEALSVQETCIQMKEAGYEVPMTTSSEARTLIPRTLQTKPENSPSI